MVIRRKANRNTEDRIIQEARVKQARTDSDEDFRMVATKFTDAAKLIRKVMADLGSTNYEHFHGGFEECEVLLQDPLYIDSIEAHEAYQRLLGADTWLKHEADKLGEKYVSPSHFYIAWELADEPLR